ncbi:SH3 domain-binding protein 1-like [Panicum virgatum]|uniref:SH3 domain-binding protein 1-like n=1 Tax=Panicum virgatum TaxID=38727 RepID=UPI0019D67B71|nr:SH3 domain-binding protein 1-like [Panicum virgatum]
MAARLASDDAAVGDPAVAAPSSSSAAGRDLVRAAALEAGEPEAAALEAGEPEAALKLRRPPAALRRHLHLPPGSTSIPTRQHLPPSLPLPRRRACGTATRAQHGSTVELSLAPLPSSPLCGGGQIRTLPQRRASRHRQGRRRRRRAGPPLQRHPSSPPSAASSRGALRSRSGLRGAAGRPRRRALARLGGSRCHGASSSSPLLPGQRLTAPPPARLCARHSPSPPPSQWAAEELRPGRGAPGPPLPARGSAALLLLASAPGGRRRPLPSHR